MWALCTEQLCVPCCMLQKELCSLVRVQSRADLPHHPENFLHSLWQSGGVYDLRASAVNDERVLQYDVVLIAIGARPESEHHNP